MPLASLPGPPSGQWHLGPVAIHGYSLCVVLGIVVAVALGERRYRAAGGRRWLMLDLATLAVPAGLAGARLYRVLTDVQRYFGHDRDWVDVLRIWDGGLGLPGMAAGALVASWIWCRRSGTAIEPVLRAVVPGLAICQAIGVLGNWFSHSLYGPPTGLPWAVVIAPRSRVPGYQNFATFQPLFLYEACWDLAIGLALIRATRTRNLTGRQSLALFAGLYALGRLGTATFLLASPAARAGVLAEALTAASVIVSAAAYLYVARSGRGAEQAATIARRLRLLVPRVIAVAPAELPAPILVTQGADIRPDGAQADARPADRPGPPDAGDDLPASPATTLPS